MESKYDTEEKEGGVEDNLGGHRRTRRDWKSECDDYDDDACERKSNGGEDHHSASDVEVMYDMPEGPSATLAVRLVINAVDR